MSQADRDKWEKRYREGSYLARTHASEFLVEWLPNLPRGLALDVAAGSGRNSLCLAAAGYEVDALDISSVALERLQTSADDHGLIVNCIEIDLEEDLLPDKRYDVITMFRYTNAKLIPQLLERLADGGCFVCEEHLDTKEDVVGPSDPAFRVAPNELLSFVKDMEVRHYSEGIAQDLDGRTAALARLVACRVPQAKAD